MAAEIESLVREKSLPDYSGDSDTADKVTGADELAEA